jgi:hypothetical protein
VVSLPREKHDHHDRRDLLARQCFVVAVARLRERTDKVVSRGLGPGVDERRCVTPEGCQLGGGTDLLGFTRPSKEEQPAIAGAFFDACDIGLGQAQNAESAPAPAAPGEIDRSNRPGRRASVRRRRRLVTSRMKGLHCSDALGREGDVRQTPRARVGRGVDVHKRRDRRVAAIL